MARRLQPGSSGGQLIPFQLPMDLSCAERERVLLECLEVARSSEDPEELRAAAVLAAEIGLAGFRRASAGGGA